MVVMNHVVCVINHIGGEFKVNRLPHGERDQKTLIKERA